MLKCGVLVSLNRAAASSITTDTGRATFNTVTVEVSLTGFFTSQFSHLRGNTICFEFLDNVGEVGVSVHQSVAVTL